VVGVVALFVTGIGAEPTPVPTLEWQPWRLIGSCGGAEYFVSVSKYDGRNDTQVKLKARNVASHLVSTRFDVVLISDEGEKTIRAGGSRINPGREVDGNNFSLGRVFETRVNAVLPSRLVRLDFTRLETANVEKLPPYASPSTYLSDFHDFPKDICGPLSVGVEQGEVPRFMRLTTECYAKLPRWTPACQDAVDEILAVARTAPESRVPCLKDWRAFQQCYESYAYGPNPDPRPDCIQQLPRCNLP